MLAVIPARGGSKSIPLKNLAVVGGQPLIAWTIKAAREASPVDRIVVTTDSTEIAEVARQCGAEVPFLRPASLAADDTPGIEPILHAVNWLGDHKQYGPELVMTLQPTSPLRTAADIEAAVELVCETDADAVVSVSLVKHHPSWMKCLDKEGRMTDFLADQPPVHRRQDLSPVYALNGAVYLARREVLLEQKTWFTVPTVAYIMPPDRSLDVDGPWDLHLADLILKDLYASPDY